MKKYFGMKKETTNWSYSHGQPVWLVDLQKFMVLAIPIGIGGAIFVHFTGLNSLWFLVPVNAIVCCLVVR